jgi:hypothetical protein
MTTLILILCLTQAPATDTVAFDLNFIDTDHLGIGSREFVRLFDSTNVRKYGGTVVRIGDSIAYSYREPVSMTRIERTTDSTYFLYPYTSIIDSTGLHWVALARFQLQLAKKSSVTKDMSFIPDVQISRTQLNAAIERRKRFKRDHSYTSQNWEQGSPKNRF